MSKKQALFFARATKFLFTVHQRMWSTLVRPKAPSCSWPICSRRNIFALLFHIKTVWFPSATCRSPSSPPALQGRFARLPELPSSLPRAMTCFTIQSFFARLKKKKRQPAASLHQELDWAIDASRVWEILLDNRVEWREVTQQGARHHLKGSRVNLAI